MRVNQVDLISRTIRLWRGETKSGEPRLVKMTQEVTLLLTECLRAKGPECHVFTRENGKLVLDFRNAWESYFVKCYVSKGCYSMIYGVQQYGKGMGFY